MAEVKVELESKVITNNHSRLVVDYDGKQFQITRVSIFEDIPNGTIELDPKEAQSLAFFILWRGLQWR